MHLVPFSRVLALLKIQTAFSWFWTWITVYIVMIITITLHVPTHLFTHTRAYTHTCEQFLSCWSKFYQTLQVQHLRKKLSWFIHFIPLQPTQDSTADLKVSPKADWHLVSSDATASGIDLIFYQIRNSKSDPFLIFNSKEVCHTLKVKIPT